MSSRFFVLHDDDDDYDDNDDDVLQVFLTVNSLAKVYWDGTFEKRRLELNWVNPPDVQREDYVGLFRVDPQWFGISSEISFRAVNRKQKIAHFKMKQNTKWPSLIEVLEV